MRLHWSMASCDDLTLLMHVRFAQRCEADNASSLCRLVGELNMSSCMSCLPNNTWPHSAALLQVSMESPGEGATESES